MKSDALSRSVRSSVLCVLAPEQRDGYESEFKELQRQGVEMAFEESPEHAFDLVAETSPRLVIVGMTVGMMDGLEFLALLMQRHKDFAGKVIVLPDKGDPFPPMLQFRDPSTGRSSTQAIDFAAIQALITGEPAPSEEQVGLPKPSEPEPERVSERRRAPPLPRAKLRSVPKLEPMALNFGVEHPRAVFEAKTVPAPALVQPEAVSAIASANEPIEAAVVPLVPAQVEELPPAATLATPERRAQFSSKAGAPLLAGVALVGLILAGLVVFLIARSKPAAREEPVAPAPTRSVSARAEPPASPQPAAPVTPVAAKATDLHELTTLPLGFSRRSADYTVLDSASLDSIVRSITRSLEENPRARLEVGGHTSEEGAPGFNFELGRSRATTVQRLLVERGVPEARIVLKNYEATTPAAGAGLGADADRRVTVRLLGERAGVGR